MLPKGCDMVTNGFKMIPSLRLLCSSFHFSRFLRNKQSECNPNNHACNKSVGLKLSKLQFKVVLDNMQFGEEPGRLLYDKVSFQDICRRLPNFEFHQMFWQCWPIAIMASLLHASWTILGRFDNPLAISPF